MPWLLASCCRLLAVDRHCSLPPPRESTPMLATVTFSSLLPDCRCHYFLLSTTAWPLVPTFLPPPWSMRCQNAPFTPSAAFVFTAVSPPIFATPINGCLLICCHLLSLIHSITLRPLLSSAACSIIFHHCTAPINGWLLFFVGCPSPTLLPSARVVVDRVLPHNMSAKYGLPCAILMPDDPFWYHW
jgi:hypothetical protein